MAVMFLLKVAGDPDQKQHRGRSTVARWKSILLEIQGLLTAGLRHTGSTVLDPINMFKLIGKKIMTILGYFFFLLNWTYSAYRNLVNISFLRLFLYVQTNHRMNNRI